MATILVVDDKENIVELAKLYLAGEGYETLEAYDGLAALEMIRKHNPDLVLLDLMLPRMNGREICKQLRQEGNMTPIIMVTARTDDVDKILGLELGADDYVCKPFNPRELTARVKAVLRRYQVASQETESLSLGALHIDKDRHEVHIGERMLELRPKEFDLLLAFAENVGIVMDRERLLNRVWGYDYYGDTRTVDVHVAHLRDKLGESGLAIETIRGIGYKFVMTE